MKETTMVFVYGSLLRGERNHSVMRDATFIRAARTAQHYTLYDLGSFPALVAAGTHAVAGEIFEVDEQMLEHLDRFEGHPRYYRRGPITLERGALVDAYLMTVHQVAGKGVVGSGDWRKRDKGER